MGSDRATRLPKRGLTALVLFFHWDSVPDPYAQRGLFNPPDPLSKGVIRAYGLSIAYGLSLPAISGPSSEDALVTLGRISLLCCAAAFNPDDARGLFVLYVFAAVTGWAKSTLLPTSLDSRVQIRPFCTRHAISELSRGQIKPFCPRRPSLILSRTAARAAAKARSAQVVSQFAAGYAAIRCAALPDSI